MITTRVCVCVTIYVSALKKRGSKQSNKAKKSYAMLCCMLYVVYIFLSGFFFLPVVLFRYVSFNSSSFLFFLFFVTLYSRGKKIQALKRGGGVERS